MNAGHGSTFLDILWHVLYNIVDVFLLSKYIKTETIQFEIANSSDNEMVHFKFQRQIQKLNNLVKLYRNISLLLLYFEIIA